MKHLRHYNEYNSDGMLVEAKAKTPDELGYMLNLAARKDNIVQVKALIKAGANVNYKSILPGYNYDNKCTALFYTDSPHIVKLLIKAGADINIKSDNGCTPLISQYKPSIIKVLIEAGADMSIRTDDGFNFIDVATDREPEYKKWLYSDKFQKMILSRDPSLLQSFKKNGIKIHPNIQIDMPHLFAGMELNLL